MNNLHNVDKVALLGAAFKSLNVEELQQVADLASIESYPPDHVLCQEGATEEIFYIIAEGNIEISKRINDEGQARILRIGGRGDIVGEMALIQNEPRSATVKTTNECTVLEMEKKDFELILSRFPRMAIDLMGVTIDRIRENDKTAIQDLQKTNEILRQLDRNKLEFIQVAAHELRTPLTVIKGYVDVLKSFPELVENASIEGVLNGISSGTERMHSVVNLMLDITRFDDENLKLNPAPISLKILVENLVRDFRAAAEERNIMISTNSGEGLKEINGDPDMIKKAAYHLIVNAIKYTPDGGKISIDITNVNLENDEPGMQISVKDSGIGLDPEHHDLIFEKFYQVGSVSIHSSGKTTFKGGGPGLGLAIVSSVARKHGGKIWVESSGHDEEKLPGSCFFLALPVSPVKTEN